MTLSNFQIEKIVKRLRPDFYFYGAVSKNECPSFYKNGSVVLNIENATDAQGVPLPGSHWVSCGIDKKGQAWYFDSFGLHPLPSFVDRIKQDEHDALSSSATIYYNPVEVQSVHSKNCGYFAIAACIACSSDAKKGLKYLLNLFDSPMLLDNDRIVKKFINKHDY